MIYGIRLNKLVQGQNRPAISGITGSNHKETLEIINKIEEIVLFPYHSCLKQNRAALSRIYNFPLIPSC